MSFSLIQAATIQDEIDERINLGYNRHIVAAIFTPKECEIFSAGGFVCAPEEALFEIGSLTKLFTAHLAFLFEEEGFLSTNEPISKYLPNSWKIRAQPITLRHILSHTSGIVDPPSENYKNLKTGNTVISAEYSLKDLKKYLDDLVFENLPGKRLNYSNLGYALIGYILEHVSGKKYSELLREKILDPLQMTSTFVDVPLEKKERLIEGTNNGQPVAHWHPKMPAFASIKSTINDMSRYGRALFFSDDLKMRRIRQKLSQPILEFEALPISSTCGLTVDRRYKGELLAGGGRTLGFSSFMGMSVNNKKGAVLLTDASALDSLGHRWLNPSFPKTSLRKTINMDRNKLREYEGRYFDDTGEVEIEIKGVEGQLVLSSPGELPLTIYPCSETEFFSKDLSLAGIEIEIKKNLQGEKMFCIRDEGALEVLKEGKPSPE